VSKKEIEQLFTEINKFKKEQNKQKKRGLNDYNLLTTVLKYHDEVRVHSRIIASLLDIYGSHYQDTFFLDKFLEIVGIQDYNSSNSKIYLEHKQIDLYLTDGTRHIIIENKIWARDQKSQIKRYIKTILEENNDLKDSDIYVIYLSINRETPSSYSLGKVDNTTKEEYFKINGNILEYKGEEEILKDKKIKLISLHYKDKILEWLNKCQYEVQNITNLNEVFNQYINVVKMLSGKYKGKILKMEDEILLEKDNLKTAIQDLPNAIKESKIKVQVAFWKKLQEILKDKGYEFEFVHYDFSEIDLEDRIRNYVEENQKFLGLKYDILDINKTHRLHLYIEIENNVYYGFTVSEKEINEDTKKEKYVRKEIANESLFDKYREQVKNKFNIESTSWWIGWKYPPKKLDFKSFSSDEIFDLVDNLFNSGNNELIDNLAKDVIALIEKCNKCT